MFPIYTRQLHAEYFCYSFRLNIHIRSSSVSKIPCRDCASSKNWCNVISSENPEENMDFSVQTKSSVVSYRRVNVNKKNASNGKFNAARRLQEGKSYEMAP